MRQPRFTIRRLMMAVSIVAMLLALVRSGADIKAAIQRQIFRMTDRFHNGTTSAGVGVPPDR